MQAQAGMPINSIILYLSQNNIIIFSDSCKRIINYQFILRVLIEYPVKLLYHVMVLG